MRRADLLRSSGLRVAIFYTGLFLLAAAVAGAAAYLVIRQELVVRHEDTVEQDFRFFEGIYNSGGRDDLIEAIRTEVAVLRAKDKIFLLLDADRNKIVGNLDTPPQVSEKGEVEAQSLGLEGDYNYYVLSRRLGEMSLIVGSSAEDIREVEEVFLQGAMWAILLLVAISLSGGMALAVRMNGRIADIEAALEKVAGGRFDIRLPKSGAGDDIDRLTILVDETIQRLGVAVETNRQVTTDIAHDLKTPMNRLRIDVEKAIERGEKGLPVTDLLEAIEAESTGILATFDALLRIAQIESGARKARFSTIDVNAIMSDIVDLYGAHAVDTGASISFAEGKIAGAVSGDRELLAQLFANLIGNALKHGGANPVVQVRTWQDRQSVHVVVSDNGEGIAVEERENVFRRLYRLEKSRTTPGSGLGLSLVKAIAALHDATIKLTDAKPGLAVELCFQTQKTTK